MSSARRAERPVSLLRQGLRLIPMFWVGEYVFDTMTRQIEDCYDAVYQMTRKRVTEFMGGRLLGMAIILNPRLNTRQRGSLKCMLSAAVDQLIWERTLDPRVLRGLLALACPNEDTFLLWGYLVEVITEIVNGITYPEEVRSPSVVGSDVECSIPRSSRSLRSEEEEEGKIAQILFHDFCIEQPYVSAMSPSVRKAILRVLRGEVELPLKLRKGRLVWSEESSPICSITLEPLLRQDGTLANDVVAVIQKTQTLGSDHAFLYRGKALFEWLGHTRVPTNPETRSVVKPTDIYRLS